MENMDDCSIELDPETESYCTLYLYKNVQNSNAIRKKLINGELSCAVIKATVIVDPLHVLVAANKAALNAKFNRLTTKNIYTELLFCLSVSKNISRSLEEFGITDNEKNILVVLIHKENMQTPMSKVLDDNIKGEKVPLSKLSEFTDFTLIKKIYKIENDELYVSSYVDSIVSRISCKDFASVK